MRTTEVNQAWSLDFVADQLTDGRRFRALTIVDVFTRESFAIEVGPALKGTDVVEVLNRLRFKRMCRKKMLLCDNGSEFTSVRIMDLGATAEFRSKDRFQPDRGKPTDNAYIRNLQRDAPSGVPGHALVPELLAEAQESIEAWRQEYNESRPHRALGERTPNEFAKGIAASRDSIGQQTAENSP